MADPEKESDDQGSSQPGKPQPPKMRMSRGAMSWIAFIVVAATIALLLQSGMSPARKVDIGTFWADLEAGKIESVTIREDAIEGMYIKETPANPKKPREFRVGYPTLSQFNDLQAEIRKTAPNPVKVAFKESHAPMYQMLIGIIPWILIFLFIWFFFIRQLRNSAGGCRRRRWSAP